MEPLEYDRLKIKPPSAEEIAHMPKQHRDQLMSLSTDTLDSIFKGFSTGDRLRKRHTEKDWLPSLELMNASLFAGQNNFKGLQDYTYQQISDLSVQLKNPETGRVESCPVPTDNIVSSLGIVERLNQGKNRRTGEPVISHMYRCFLRTKKMIDYYNDIYNRYNTHTVFTPDLAEVASVLSNLHDFEEDKNLLENSIHVGIAKALPTGGPSNLLYLRHARLNKRGTLNVIEDIRLSIKPYYIPYIANALEALNSTDTAQDKVIEKIISIVNSQYATINPQEDIFPEYVLSTMPLYIKTGADRPDNLATYFTANTVSSIQTPVNVEKLVTKAQENLYLFDKAELYLSLDNLQQYNSFSQLDSPEKVTSDCSLPFSNRRWAILALLGLSPNEMMRINQDGDLPEVI